MVAPELRRAFRRPELIEPGHQGIPQRRRNWRSPAPRWRTPDRPGWPCSRCAASTNLVTSSTNKGTPSVWVTMCCSCAADSRSPPSHCTICVTCWEANRGTVRSVTWVRPPQGDANVGRHVSRVNSGAVGPCAISMPNHSSVVGSIQCRSSTIKQHRLLLGEP